MALTANGTLIVCDVGNDRLKRADPNNGNVTAMGHPFERPSDGTQHVTTSDGLHEVRSADGVVSRLAVIVELRNQNPLSCHLDEPSGLLYVATTNQLLTVSAQTVGERRASRLFSLVRIWTLAQLDRTDMAPTAGIIGMDEARGGAALPQAIHLRLVGVLESVLRFAFGYPNNLTGNEKSAVWAPPL